MSTSPRPTYPATWRCGLGSGPYKVERIWESPLSASMDEALDEGLAIAAHMDLLLLTVWRERRLDDAS